MRLRLICWKSFFGALSALTALVPAFGQSLQFAAPEAKTNYDLAGKPFPVWSGGALLVRQGAQLPVVDVFDQTGAWKSTVAFTIPDAAVVETFSVGRTPNGGLVMCGLAISSSGQVAPYISLASPDGKTQQVFRTDSFSPRACTVAADGTIWVAGEELVNGHEGNFDHGMVRQFDQSGRVIASFIPRSLYPTKGIVSPPMGSKLSANGNRIGWYSPSTKDYFEIAEGRIRQVSAAPILEPHDHVDTVALTDDGRAFLGIFHLTQHNWRIAALDPGANTWVLFSPPGGSDVVYGASGNTLVAGTKNLLHFYQFSAAAQ